MANISKDSNVVGQARGVWRRRHPVLTGLIVLVLVAGVGAGGYFAVQAITAPQLPCGPGMAANSTATACIGVDLASGPLSPTEPARMGQLEGILRDANNAVSGPYISVVLLLDMSPVAGVDTESYDQLYPNIEAVITAAWRANHTEAFHGDLPQVKLFLANMGTGNAGWSDAADRIGANAAANRITAVVGIGQSTDATRRATAKLTEQYHLPVIGATVTGDNMNTDPNTHKLMTGFFRVSRTNTDSVAAAVQYIKGLTDSWTKVAIVQDNAGGDDHTQTLTTAADRDMPSAHQFPYTSPRRLPAGVQRSQVLSSQFFSVVQNICSIKASIVYFAGRGADLPAFVQTWVQSGTSCANRKLTIITADDGAEALTSTAVHQAIASGKVQVLFTPLASPDEWGSCPSTNATTQQANYYTFKAAFTGQNDECTNQPATSDKTQPLSFDATDLRSGQAMLTHDAATVAIVAARRDGTIAVHDPASQIGIIEEMRCISRVQGASGWTVFSPDDKRYGNPSANPSPWSSSTPTGSTTWDTNESGPSSSSAGNC